LTATTSFAGEASAIGPLAIERQAPRHAHQPGPKPVAIAKLTKAAIRLGKRLLRDVFRILRVSQDAERHPKRERGRFQQPRFELVFKVLIDAHASFQGLMAGRTGSTRPCISLHQARRRGPGTGSVGVMGGG
jgi:hypothetical protein